MQGQRSRGPLIIPQPTITKTSPNPIDHTVNAGDVVLGRCNIPQPTITHTPAPGTLLTLADWNDDDLDVDAAALLEASAPGTTGNNPYADSDRGGTDSPSGWGVGAGH